MKLYTTQMFKYALMKFEENRQWANIEQTADLARLEILNQVIGSSWYGLFIRPVRRHVLSSIRRRAGKLALYDRAISQLRANNPEGAIEMMEDHMHPWLDYQWAYEGERHHIREFLGEELRVREAQAK